MHRSFAALLVLSAIALPSIAQDVPTIGILGFGSREGAEPTYAAFREGLREQGFVEGKNVRIVYRQTSDDTKLRALADELVQAKVALIFARGTLEVYAAKAATRTIPIVFALVSDPVAHSFADSFARPGGNITGVSVLTQDLTSKRLEVARDAFPKATKLAVLFSESHRQACGMELKQLERDARTLGVELVVTGFSAPEKIPQAIDELRRSGASAVVIPLTVSNSDHTALIARHAGKHSMPTIQDLSSTGLVHGLLAYGPALRWTFGRAGNIAGQILKGAKAAETPIEQPHLYELIVNLKLARSQDVPLSKLILLRATRIIE